MNQQLLGLHHVTAVTAQAQKNLEFYTQTLGMCLVKKTVNQDDVSAYHLFYADSEGRPGTDMTFFDWAQAAPRRVGPGSVIETALRVSGSETLAWWEQRLEEMQVPHGSIEERAGRLSLPFTDFEGQHLRLVDDGGAPGGIPWDRASIPSDKGIRGLDAVTLCVRHAAPTARVLTQVLGLWATREYTDVEQRPVTVYEMGAGGPGTEVHLVTSDGPSGTAGRGGVHHVAFRTPNAEEQQEWHKRLTSAGLGVSPLIDRFYFQSLYFREPGGILFEIATDGPGFAADEDAAHLGEHLALPPFLEPHRTQIEAGLAPLSL
jgi:glyoxalase family protein